MASALSLKTPSYLTATYFSFGSKVYAGASAGGLIIPSGFVSFLGGKVISPSFLPLHALVADRITNNREIVTILATKEELEIMLPFLSDTMPWGRLELPRSFLHMNLNHACLPIPAPRLWDSRLVQAIAFIK
jgi:hypothetical protein